LINNLLTGFCFDHIIPPIKSTLLFNYNSFYNILPIIRSESSNLIHMNFHNLHDMISLVMYAYELKLIDRGGYTHGTYAYYVMGTGNYPDHSCFHVLQAR